MPYSLPFYFFDGAKPRGASYDAIQKFEKDLNDKLKTKHLKLHLIVIPTARENLFRHLESAGLIAVPRDAWKYTLRAFHAAQQLDSVLEENERLEANAQFLRKELQRYTSISDRIRRWGAIIFAPIIGAGFGIFVGVSIEFLASPVRPISPWLHIGLGIAFFGLGEWLAIQEYA